jgi:hypothetical protein
MLLGNREKATGSSRIADPQLDECRQPPLASDDSLLMYAPERRRIVAQVRREVPKNRGFFASQK